MEYLKPPKSEGFTKVRASKLSLVRSPSSDRIRAQDCVLEGLEIGPCHVVPKS